MSGQPREIHLRIPRDILRKLLDTEKEGYPFQTPELGFPLRIVLWGAPARQPRGYKVRPQPKEDDDSL